MPQEYIDSESDNHDIALVFLKNEHLRYSHVVVAANFIRSDAPKFPVGTKVTLVGWGNRGVFVDNSVAHKGTVEIIPDRICQTDEPVGHAFDSGYHLCYGCTVGRCPMASKGDSGGPVVTDGGVVVAVVSGGCTPLTTRNYLQKCRHQSVQVSGWTSVISAGGSMKKWPSMILFR